MFFILNFSTNIQIKYYFAINIFQYLFFPANTIQEKEKLQSLVAKLRQKLSLLLSEIEALQANETYQGIAKIADWQAYFAEIKVDLQAEKDSFC